MYAIRSYYELLSVGVSVVRLSLVRYLHFLSVLSPYVEHGIA